MKKVLIYKITTNLILWSFVFSTLNAQGEPLKFYAISTGVGYYSPLSQESAGGLTMNLDFSVKLSDDVFSIYFRTGFSEQFVFKEDFMTLNITYGRTLKLSKRWLLEGHFGLGYIRQKVRTISFDFEENEYVDHAISLPFRPKILYRFSDTIGLGLNPNLNLNGIQTFYSIDLIFQYNF